MTAPRPPSSPSTPRARVVLGISREEATMLGSQRREELRRQRDRDSTAIGRLKTLLQVGARWHAVVYLHVECMAMS